MLSAYCAVLILDLEEKSAPALCLVLTNTKSSDVRINYVQLRNSYMQIMYIN